MMRTRRRRSPSRSWGWSDSIRSVLNTQGSSSRVGSDILRQLRIQTVQHLSVSLPIHIQLGFFIGANT
jgi:hypothetical protein